MNTQIKDPEFVDLEKTTVRFKIIRDGVTTVAELKVPETREKGINPYWDRIMDEFDVEAMRQQRNEKEVRARKLAEFDKKKREGREENEKLVALFNLKMQMFNLSIFSEADDATKAAIRRSPNKEFLNFIYYDTLRKYMNDNNLSYIDLLEKLEDSQTS